MANYLTSVGMEVHAELTTASKMFCRCPVAFGGEPNTRTCPVCLGLPGSLPVPNRLAIEQVIRTAMALNCTIARRSVFHRKNYFYPDLPKGYQVSQYGETNPLGYHGWLDIPLPSGETKRIKIRRVHLEEDTGKLIHMSGGGSGVDYNRAGVPLMEIVTEFPPDISSPDEAKEYLVQLRTILVYLGVCDGKMEEGSLRCEPNISIRPVESTAYGTKTELKNLSSFRSVQLGIAFETRRQTALLDSGSRVIQETRGWNEGSETSFSMRAKEEENDYRYFEDPDLIPMEFDEAYLDTLRAGLPELPIAKAKRYQSELGLGEKDAGVLVADRAWAAFFEEGVRLGGEPKLVCNWLCQELAKLLNDHGRSIEDQPVTPAAVVDLLNLLSEGKINGKMAKQIFAESFASGTMPSEIVAQKGLSQVTDTDALTSIVKGVIQANPDPVAKIKAGHQNAMGFLVGQVMSQTQGKANPELVNRILAEELERS